MRYRPQDAPALLRTPLGRRQVAAGCLYRASPLLVRAARLHRATLGRSVRVVAVAGSFGKTTTARAAAAVLGARADRQRDNFASYVALAVLGLKPSDRHAVIEVGIDGPGQMERYAELLRPQVAVVTAIGSEHGRTFRTLDATREAKAPIVTGLPANGWAILNGDDPNVRWMATRTEARVLTFGFEPGNDVFATDVALDWPHGTRFTLHVPGHSSCEVRLRLLGRPMVAAALAAAAAGAVHGLDPETIAQRLEALAPTPGRAEAVPLPGGAFAIRDDYKGAVETFDAALDLLEAVPARRRVVVLGDVEEPPGSQGPVYRRLGARLAEVADHVFFLTPQRRRYTAGARSAGRELRYTRVREGVLAAAATVSADLGPGDVVLVKGRSTERLDRVALALAGRRVGCELRSCNAIALRCASCPMLERGWDGLRVVL